MKSQLYTNITLTVIAVLLFAIILQEGAILKARKDVRIVAIAKPSKDEMQKARATDEQIWSDLPISGSVYVDGSVDVNEPLEVKIQ